MGCHSSGGDDLDRAAAQERGVLADFVGKFAQIVARARQRPAVRLRRALLLDAEEFWAGGVPLNVDVAEGTRLLERWIVALDRGLGAPAAEAPPDPTSLILLAQSLYAHVRLLPLASAPADVTAAVALADGRALDGGAAVPAEFAAGAALEVHRFSPAPFGSATVRLCVIYDTLGPAGLPAGSPAAPVKVAPPPLSPVRGHGASSPFPSPSMHRKALGFAHLRFDKRALAAGEATGSGPGLGSSALGLGPSVLGLGPQASDYEAPIDPPANPPPPTRRNPADAPKGGAKALVGSYEDSLLHARMSTLPSRPIDFSAEVGVVGLGKCRSSLRCPPHVTVTFPAWFYDLAEERTPSTPYVGFVRLHDARDQGVSRFGYRVPPRGQLQIIIKNPALTAVKVFLVPFDLTDMPPASRTLLRQKSYASASGAREHLRYAVHLQFVSPARKRHYLSPTLRVVFGHRTLDMDERIRTIVQVSTPKYVALPGRSASGALDDSGVSRERSPAGSIHGDSDSGDFGPSAVPLGAALLLYDPGAAVPDKLVHSR